LVFRQLVEGLESRTHELTTYTLTRTGGEVRIGVEVKTFKDGKFVIDHADDLAGTATTHGDVTTIEASTMLDHLGSPPLKLTCRERSVPVAAATAMRIRVPDGEGTKHGKWSPAATKNVKALVCSDKTTTFVFATPSVEHVIADDSCCANPGDSLRFVPADGSVAVARDPKF
jgi:hypothetical protein